MSLVVMKRYGTILAVVVFKFGEGKLRYEIQE
jgi:hypothetical protein